MDLIYRYDPHQPLVVDRPVDSAAATERLIAGNRRFVEFVGHLQAATLGDAAAAAVVPIDLMSLGLPILSGVALDQCPFAFVLGCSDARAPVEAVFDQFFNDLFVVRVAGNVLGTECLGSFDYAVRSFDDSLRLALVLGHSNCGAVTAAVDAYLAPTGLQEIAATHAMRSLIDRIMVAVRAAERELERQTGGMVRGRTDYRELLIETSVFLNAAITGYDLTREVTALCLPKLRVVYGVFDLSDMVVRALPRGPEDATKCGDSSFGLAPSNAEDFLQIAERIVGAALGMPSTGTTNC